MPQYFHFTYNDDDPQQSTTFDGVLQSRRCEFLKPNGQQCRNQCVIGQPCCYAHTPSKYHLRIKESTIPHTGKGLFANEPGHRDDIVFHGARQTRYGRVAGDTICPYNGQVINTHQLEQRYGEQTAPYAIRVKDNKYEDAALQRGIGSLANHKPRAQSNTEFVVSRDYINLRATKNIRNGQELFVSYGNDYHLNEPGVHTTTNRSKYHYV